MTTDQVLFPELVAEIENPQPIPCAYPLFVVAYHPRHGGWPAKWKIHYPLDYAEVSHQGLQGKLSALQSAGWTHIHVMRLPVGGPWSEKK